MNQATPAMGDSRENKEAREGEREKEAAPRLSSCACCELGLFGVHGVGHVTDQRDEDAA